MSCLISFTVRASQVLVVYSAAEASAGFEKAITPVKAKVALAIKNFDLKFFIFFDLLLVCLE